MTGTFLTVARAHHIWPFPTKGGLPASYQYTWNGQIQIPFLDMSVQLTLTLGSGGLNDSVGSISSSTLGCKETVYLANADDPVTLRLDTSSSSPECQLEGAPFHDARISLIGSDLLRFTIDVFGRQQSCNLSR